MKRLYLWLVALVLLAHGANAELIYVPNEAGTGTTVGKLARFTVTNPVTAIITATPDIARIAGVVVGTTGTSGTTGNAIIAVGGVADCIVDAGGVTAGSPLVNSTVTNGDCMDGAGHPQSEVVGYAMATVASGTVKMHVANRRTIVSPLSTPIVISAAGNLDLSTTGANSPCGIGINYTGATGTLTILNTAAPGCIVPVTTSTNLVTIAAQATGTFQTACSPVRTRAAGSVITIWVLSNSGTDPKIAVGGDCG